MSEKTHTAAWELLRVYPDDGRHAWISIDEDGDNECDIRIDGANAQAIGQLVMTAPDMLAVLQDIQDFLKRSGYDTRLVRAAIRKATGAA